MMRCWTQEKRAWMKASGGRGRLSAWMREAANARLREAGKPTAVEKEAR
jgi:hypothetical protein